MANFFNYAPKNPGSFTITRKKMIYTLIVALCFIGIYKSVMIGVAEKNLLETKIIALLSQVNDLSQTDKLNQSFTNAPFCGWKHVMGDATDASPGFDDNLKNGDLFSKDFVKDGIQQNFSICINAYSSINNSVTRSVIITIFVTVIIIALIYLGDEKTEEKIPTA